MELIKLDHLAFTGLHKFAIFIKTFFLLGYVLNLQTLFKIYKNSHKKTVIKLLIY